MNISILGCGWLGLPLAEALIEQGHQIKGSTTTRDKRELLLKKNIEPYVITLNPELNCEDCQSFWKSEVLVLNIPPGRRRDDVVERHTRQILAVITELRESPISFVVFVSSTSVYPKKPGIVKEQDAKSGKAGRDSGNALLEAERLLNNEESFDTTVVRFGGLYGYDRHPAKYLAGKTSLGRGKAPVNLIHRDDCVHIITRLINEDRKGEIFNAVSDGHPPREMYYKAVAEARGMELPVFKKDQGKNYKIVSNLKLKRALGYRFKHPNPMDVDALDEKP